MVTRFLASVTLLLALAVPAQGASTSAPRPAGATRPIQRIERLILRGITAPTQLGEFRAPASAYSGLETRPEKRGFRAIDVHPAARLRSAAFAAAAIPIPNGPNFPVVPAEPDFFGFFGLTHADQRNAGTGIYVNTQFSLEPPDQGLCAGNGYVVDVVNDALAVYSSFGTRLTAPTALTQFFGLTPEINRTTKRYGDFPTDPRCYFDRDTQRWFLTQLTFDTDPATGAFGHKSAIHIAVSRTADPTRGYNVYSFDATDAANPGCPCYGDQPLIGADANGFFVSTNEYPLAGAGFNGAQVYALAKIGLTNGTLSSLVHLNVGALPTPDIGGQWYSLEPAETPDTAAEGATNNGTEYFMSALDFFNLNDNRIAVWALTNTRSLRNPVSNLGLQHVVIGSVAYGQPPPAVQKPGPTPLATSLGDPLALIDTNDDRMAQVVFAGGRLWAGLNTAVRFGSNIDAGIVYFAVVPGFNRSGFLTAHMAREGYVAVAGQTVVYPSIGVNASGGAVMAATLTGPAYFPTAVYVTGDAKVHIAGPGAGPDDGFTAYRQYGGNGAGRWGDYSAAVADADGSIWIAAEYIPGGPRTLLANWGTFIGHVRVH